MRKSGRTYAFFVSRLYFFGGFMNHNFALETEPLGKLMRKFSVPCVISLLVGALYNIVDQIFIANASYLGSYGNAANTAVFPLTVAALALALMIGDGCSTFLSLSLGANKTDDAKRAAESAVFVSVIGSLVLMIIYLIFSDSIIRFFGGNVNEQTYAFAKEYFFYITAGLPFYMFGQGLNPLIRADGSPKYAMFATLAGALTNVILDPVLIYAVPWGMKGAAIATVAGQLVTAVLTLRYLMNMNTVHLTLSDLKIDPEIMKQYVPLGITSFLSQISLVASMAAVNSMVMKYSILDPLFGNPEYTQIPMAVIGIVMKFFQIVISAVVGTAAGCAPVAAYNTGAGKNQRVKDLFVLLLKTEAAIGFCALVIAEAFPRTLISLFGASNESVFYTEFAVKTFRIYLSMIVLACINKASFIYLQALGRAFLSTMLSMVREVVLGVALPVILPLVYGLDGILFSMPAADLITFALTVIVILYIFSLLEKNAQERFSMHSA